MGKSVEEMLAGMNETWEKGKDGPVVPPDGEYMMQLVSAEIRPNKAGDKLLCARQHTIIEGEYANTVVRDFISLNENQIFRLKQWIEQMGYEAPDDLSQVPAVLEAIIAENPTYTANLKSSGDFLNVTDFEVVGSGGEGDEEEVVQDAGEVKGEQPEGEGEAEGEEAAPEGGEVVYEDQDHLDLYTVAAACGVTVPEGLTKDQLVAEMKGYDWDYNDFTENPEGLALIEKYKMDIVNKPAPAKKPVAAVVAKKAPVITKVAPAHAKPATPAKTPVATSAVAKKPAAVTAPVAKKTAPIIRKK